MYDLTRFSLKDMTECGAKLRRAGDGASSMEEVSHRIVSFLYQTLIEPESGQKACALVRLFKTHPFGDLDEQLQEFARRLLENQPESENHQFPQRELYLLLQ